MKQTLAGLALALAAGSALAQPVQPSAPIYGSGWWNSSINKYQIPLLDSSGYPGVVVESGGGAGGTTSVSALAGAFVDGWNVTMGTKADGAWSGTGNGSEIAIDKAIYEALVAPLPAGTNSIGSVVLAPGGAAVGTPTQTTGTCGTTSSSILAVNAATSSESFHLAAGATNAVWLNFAGAVASQASPNFDLQPGQTITFTAVGGLLPTSAVTCIAAVTTSVVEIYK